MKNWTIHWLDASGNFYDHRSPIIEALQSAYAVLARYVQIPKMDVLIQRADGHTIPELGISGRAYRASLFALSFDPDNPNFANSLFGGALVRQIVHEVHHCLRMAGQGYGKTFGEALVSEGLAGRFVQHVMQSQPELWEAAIPISELKAFMVKKSMLSEVRYDHSRWFFGRGSIPRWFGYTLGYEIVGNWLITVRADTVDWINVPAGVPITAAIKSGLIAKD